MTSRDFAYWLQGFFEISGATEMTAPQVEQLKKHLHMVFEHEIDPSAGDAKTQEKLNQIHHGGSGGFGDTKIRC
jgi:hypothetical protein